MTDRESGAGDGAPTRVGLSQDPPEAPTGGLDDLRKRVEEWELRVAPGYGTVLIRDLWRAVQEKDAELTELTGHFEALQRKLYRQREDMKRHTISGSDAAEDDDVTSTLCDLLADFYKGKYALLFVPVTAEELDEAISEQITGHAVIGALGPLYRQRKP